MSAAVSNPLEVVEQLLAGVGDGPSAELADLYAHDAVVELPFAGPSGMRIEGRDALRAHFARSGQLPIRLMPENVTLHEAADGEVVVAEYEYRIEAGGRSFRAANVQIVTVRDGLISRSRDFHDHPALGAALDGGRGRRAGPLRAPPASREAK